MRQLQESEKLQRLSISIKKRFLKMYHDANAGHVGCSLSCAEMLTFIRFVCMKRTSSHSEFSGSDRLILSKGHAAACLYSVLAEAGDMGPSEIESFYKDDTKLAAHPPPNLLPISPFATGSLGHGLSLAAGIALAKLQQESKDRVFCLSSDGELNEGSMWEAALFAAQFNLGNLYLFVDRNGIQGFGRTEEVMALGAIEKKFQSFGWESYVCDGHSFASLQGCFQASQSEISPKPKVIVCNTVKGHGLGENENTVGCHYQPLTVDQYKQILLALNTAEEVLNAK
jgi:transketolase